MDTKATGGMSEDDSEICVACFRPRYAHCEFVKIQPPKNCICDPWDWGDPAKIPDICDHYEIMGGKYEDIVCKHCEHEPECHIMKMAEGLVNDPEP
jgi:hypothetical protein